MPRGPRPGAGARDGPPHPRPAGQGARGPLLLRGLEAGRRAEVVDEGAEVVGLVGGLEDAGPVGRLPGLGPPAEVREVALEDGQRDHHVVGGVAHELAQGPLPPLEGLQGRADLGPGGVEGPGEVGDLVGAGHRDGDGVALPGGAPDLCLEAADAADEGARGKQHGQEDPEARHAGAEQDLPRRPLGEGAGPAGEDDHAGALAPRHAERHLEPRFPPVVVLPGGEGRPLLEGLAEIRGEGGGGGVGGGEVGAVGGHEEPSAGAGRTARTRGARGGGRPPGAAPPPGAGSEGAAAGTAPRPLRRGRPVGPELRVLLAALPPAGLHAEEHHLPHGLLDAAPLHGAPGPGGGGGEGEDGGQGGDGEAGAEPHARSPVSRR